ncbi:MAG: sigma-70 family RNA polymerase sigma factor, partial [Planctomycetota bacterium]
MLDLPETRPSILLAIRDADDVQAWTRFQQVYGQLIFAMARRHGFQDADAADIHQEVMLRVSGSIQRFEMQRSRARFRTWLHSIVRNVMIDVHRKHGRVPPTVSTSQM